MWLQGVEEMQDSAWVPNPTQWQRIRDKINTIEEVAAPSHDYSPMIPAYPMPSAAIEQMPVHVAQPAMMPALPMPTIPAAPPAHSLFAHPDNPAVPTRTPNIDTTNGQYSSSFV